MNTTVAAVTQRIIERSRDSRADYLSRMAQARDNKPHRSVLSCGNLAHGFAACGGEDKERLTLMDQANVAIISAYNDMLSAHQPLEQFPAQIKEAVAAMGCVAQFAGGVPAMCDGVTQGQPGMELSLFSRDTIAMATAVGLSHNMFDAVLCLGVCDKIVPGLMIGSLAFGHLPVIFVPAGPMTSGLPNSEKSRIRQLYAEGKVGRDELLKCESDSYHGPGTCTFYGTANSNQLLMEAMGVHLPGASFINPNTPLREALTRAAAEQACRITELGRDYRPLSEVIDEKAIVNGIVALLATGGSTNHTMHIIAIARAAGIIVNWDDFADLSEVVPLLTRIYPNGSADINHFHAAGGMSLLFRELLSAGLLNEDVTTVMGKGFTEYTREPYLDEGQLKWREGPAESLDKAVVASIAEPFSANGGLRLMGGNLGRSVMKVSAVKPEHRVVEAPAVVLHDQDELKPMFERGELDRDCVLVVRFQGPNAIGMPELHKLTPFLGTLQDRGFKVALVTDGRMSGASGKVPAAIHLTPEATQGGLIAKVRNGDLVRVDGEAGELTLLVDDAELASREQATADLGGSHFGMGRELFSGMRRLVSGAEEGASFLFVDESSTSR
ncbi:phosphogluconate dehydratase [Marinobacterium mangrovicola]|uniref:Phosphogluconate dehydratase n=1 Tax=Marinobacterium mangrovicola TaxID=1476959 RepID=A0A4R1GGA8_9GAMM|nr:phosphogluconate dehydratase [Marinobacterium mangrovicola]TCK07497.1 6-phosphogluconate dehydratase [Marinobacterium mangrovicola]